MRQQQRPLLRSQQRTQPSSSSHFVVLLCAVVFLSCLIPTTEAQNATCQILTDGTCNQFVPAGTSVFVPGDITLDFLVLYTNRLTNLVNFVGIPEPCRSLSLQLICYTWLRPCQDPTAFPVVPKQPCIDLCFNYEKSCYRGQSAQGEPFGIGFYFPTGYNAPLNCSNPPLDIWAGGQSFYWPNETQLEINGVNQTFSCNLENPVTPPAEIICEDPLSEFYKETSRGKRPYCAFTCPLPSLTDSEYDSAKIMQGIVGWFSWAGSTILIFAMLLMPRTRDFPRNLILMCACAANVAAGAIILPSMVGYDNIWCGGADKTLEADLQFIFYDRFGLPDFTFNIDEDNLNFKSDPCSFQGAILQFGFLAAVFWWAIIAFNMCLELYFGKLLSLETPKWKWLRFVIYNILAWGTAFVLMVIPASAGKIAFSSAATYCFVTTEDDYAWISVFWFIPVGISLVAGTILFILALIRITILMIMIRKVQKLIMLYLRLSIFIVVFLIIYAFIFAYNIQIAKDKTNVESGYEDYYKCLIYSTSSCSLSNDVSNYDLVMLKGFAISVLGIFLFFLFMSWDLLVFYFNIIKGIGLIFLQRKPANIQNVFHMVAYASSTKSRTGSSVLSGTKTDVTDVNSDELEEEEDTVLEDRGSARRESPRVEKVKHKKAKKESEESEESNESSSSSSG